MEYLTVKETASLLRVSPITVRRYIAAGKLPAERIGRGIRIRRAAIDELAEPIDRGAVSVDNTSIGELPTVYEALYTIIGLGHSEEPTNIAEFKDEYIADAILPATR
ncbi:MAG: helix-turn-helix domain-containing protein [Thermomicrobiales bacterium]